MYAFLNDSLCRPSSLRERLSLYEQSSPPQHPRRKACAPTCTPYMDAHFIHATGMGQIKGQRSSATHFSSLYRESLTFDSSWLVETKRGAESLRPDSVLKNKPDLEMCLPLPD